jgi:hypothetical protein
MPLSLLNHSALALFAQRTRIPTSARSIVFCAIWVCISSSSVSLWSYSTTKGIFSRHTGQCINFSSVRGMDCKPQLRPPRCDTGVTPEEKRRSLARRAQETEQRRAFFNAEADAEMT